MSSTRAKLVAFAVSGGIAALAGALYVTSLPTNTPNATFATTESVTLVAIGVIGGLGSIVGPLLGAAWVIGLPTLFPDFAAAPLLVSSAGLLAVAALLPRRLRRGRVSVARRPRRTRGVAAPARAGSPARRRRGRAGAVGPCRHRRRSRRAGRGVAVGRRTSRCASVAASRSTAVSLHVDAREIVGLIGTNGAGKSTLMNAIGGFVPVVGPHRGARP